MSFGQCQFTEKTFAQKFPASAFTALPAPSGVTAELQFERAQQIEAEHGAARCTSSPCASNKHRFLFFVMGSENNMGLFYACPRDVLELVHWSPYYPGAFRFFVIDPHSREEVVAMTTLLDGFWKHDAQLCADKWWFRALSAHNLDDVDVCGYAEVANPKQLNK